MKHTRRCSECGRSIHLRFSRANGSKGRLPRHGAERPADHDLCSRCYKSIRQRVVAARMLPKPRWVERQRSTLELMGV